MFPVVSLLVWTPLAAAVAGWLLSALVLAAAVFLGWR